MGHSPSFKKFQALAGSGFLCDRIFNQKVMRVGDQYRTNRLSLIPGGYVVSVIFSNGRVLEYDKVKSPKKYVSSIPQKEEIVNIYVNGQEVWNDKSETKYWNMI